MIVPKLTKRLTFLAVIAGIMLCATNCRLEINVPSFLIGTWGTTSPKYKGRYIQFTEKTLAFGIGENEKDEHMVSKIKMEVKKGIRLFTFYYEDAEGDTWPFSILYNPHYNDGIFQLKNGREVWKKIS